MEHKMTITVNLDSEVVKQFEKGINEVQRRMDSMQAEIDNLRRIMQMAAENAFRPRDEGGSMN